MLKRFLNSLFTAVVLMLAVPTTLILISWNAIPGDGLYPLKSGLENIVMAAVSGTSLAPKVSMKFTDRRIGEATKLLDQKGSTVGYDLLVANARETQNYIVEKNDISAGVQFTKNIDNYKKEIAKKKVEVTAEIQAGTPSQATVSTGALTPTPTSIPTPVIATPTPEPVSVSVNVPEQTVNQTTGQTVTVNVPQTVVITQENPTEVLQKLDDTENKLNQIQEEIKKNEDKRNSEGHGRGR